MQPDKRYIMEHQDELNLIYHKYKNAVTTLLAKKCDQIVANYDMDKKKALELLAVICHENASIAVLIDLNCGDEVTTADVPMSPNCCRRCLVVVHNGLSGYVIPIVGASFMMVGCVGWIVNPFYVISNMGLNPISTVLLGALPSYSTAVLCGFYGNATFSQIYQYLTTWEGGFRNKLPFEAKCYPKLFLGLLASNLFLSALSYGTATQLIDLIFANSTWNFCHPFLRTISIPAMQILSFVPLLNLFNNCMRKVIAKFGAESDERNLSRLLVKSQTFGERMQQIEGKVLMESLALYSNEQRLKLGINSSEFTTDYGRVNKLMDELEAFMHKTEDQENPPPQSPLMYSRSMNRSPDLGGALGDDLEKGRKSRQGVDENPLLENQGKKGLCVIL